MRPVANHSAVIVGIMFIIFFLLSFFTSHVSGTTKTFNDDEASGQPLCCDCWHHASNFFYLYSVSPGVSSRTKTLNLRMIWRVVNHSAATVGIMCIYFFFYPFSLPMSVAGLKPLTLG
jgi:hypothetical protein